MRIERPLVLAEDATAGGESEPTRLVQLILGSGAGPSSRRFAIFSRAGEEEPWVRHAIGRVGAGARGEAEELSSAALRDLKGTLSPVDVPALYRELSDAGLSYGPAFRGLFAVWSAGSEALGEVGLPAGVEGGGPDVHPVVLDACFQLVVGAVLGSGSVEGETTWLPVGWEELRLAGRLPERFLCHARLFPDSGRAAADTRRADLALYGTDGTSLGRVTGFT